MGVYSGPKDHDAFAQAACVHVTIRQNWKRVQTVICAYAPRSDHAISGFGCPGSPSLRNSNIQDVWTPRGALQVSRDNCVVISCRIRMVGNVFAWLDYSGYWLLRHSFLTHRFPPHQRRIFIRPIVTCKSVRKAGINRACTAV